MKNKKAFLLGEETLKIILAVICIGFLAFLLYSIYNAGKKDKDLELAESSLEHLIKEINAGAEQIEMYNPEGWWLISWPYDDIIPNSCSNLGWKNCICICNKKNVESCEDSVCLENNFVITGEKGNYIKIEKPPLVLIINHENKAIMKK